MIRNLTRLELWLFDRRRQYAYGMTWLGMLVMWADLKYGLPQFVLPLTVFSAAVLGFILEKRGTHQREQERNLLINPWFVRNDNDKRKKE